MKIKICGITNYQDAELCCNFGATALGFIFYKKSKRFIEPEVAKSIIQKLPPLIIKVGVFVNESATTINKIANEVKVNIIQLHGDESISYINKINLPVIKAFRVSDDFNFDMLKEFADYPILLDSFSSNEYGGTGHTFDWDNIPDSIKGKIILSGGIAVDNINYIAEKIKPYAVDISSSIEIRPGIKDHKKLRALFNKFNGLKENNADTTKS